MTDNCETHSIVLVPGLKVDQKHWTSAEDSVFWPEKLLATQIPKARILTFEYDEDPTLDAFWNKRDLISSNSDDLLNSLMDERRGEKVNHGPISQSTVFLTC